MSETDFAMSDGSTAAPVIRLPGPASEVAPEPEVAPAPAPRVWKFKDTAEQARVHFPIASAIKSKDIVWEPTPTSLKVGLRGHPPIIDEELFARIKVDDSYWEIATIGGKRSVRCVLVKVKADVSSGEAAALGIVRSEAPPWPCLLKADYVPPPAPEPEGKLKYRDAFNKTVMHKDTRTAAQRQLDAAASIEREKRGGASRADWEEVAMDVAEHAREFQEPESEEQFVRRYAKQLGVNLTD